MKIETHLNDLMPWPDICRILMNANGLTIAVQPKKGKAVEYNGPATFEADQGGHVTITVKEGSHAKA